MQIMEDAELEIVMLGMVPEGRGLVPGIGEFLLELWLHIGRAAGRARRRLFLHLGDGCISPRWGLLAHCKFAVRSR
jgi:hypothetical protein